MNKKRTLHRAAFNLAAITIGFAGFGNILLTSCHDDETLRNEYGADAIEEGIINSNERPTTDQREVTYDEFAVILGYNESQVYTAIKNRMTGTTVQGMPTGNTARTYIFADKCEKELNSETDAVTLLQAYSNNANFIFINPKNSITDDLVELLNKGVEKLEAQGYETTDAENFIARVKEYQNLSESQSTKTIDAVGIRKNGIYTVNSLKEMIEASNENASAYITNEDSTKTEKNCTENDYQPTAYDYGKQADALVTWMKNTATDDSGLNGGSSDISELINTEPYYFHYTVGPSRALDKSMDYTMVFRIYSAYSFDNDKDYYFIRLSPSFNASQLECVSGTDRGWKEANKVVTFDDGTKSTYYNKNLWYGPYMSMFDVSASIKTNNNETVRTEYALPKTDTSGSTSCASGFNFSLAGHFGFNTKGPTGGVTAGITFSDSHITTENNLKVVHTDNAGNFTQWVYRGIVPQYHISWNPFNKYGTHDQVANFQINDWGTDITWVFIVEHPKKDQQYTLEVKDITEITELFYHVYDFELSVHPANYTTIQMKMPNRYKESFVMLCSDNTLQECINKLLPDTWKQEFIYYGHSENEIMEGVKDLFMSDGAKGVKGSILGLNLKERGFTDTYTFRLRKQGSSEDVATFTIENGELKN